MASILDRYGIKEVADVTFYKINSDGTRGDPVLYLDTLKVSTIEQTAESVDARGGKGNPKLVTWDYGKEITVTIEDALFSAKSMAIMFGNGTASQGSSLIQKTAIIRLGKANSGKVKLVNDYVTADIYDAVEGSKRVKLYLGSESSAPTGEVKINGQLLFEGPNGIKSKLYDEDGTVLDSDGFTESELKALYTTGLDASGTELDGHKLMFTYWVSAVGKTITVSGDTFPGTYYIQGDTYARSDVDGSDQFFQFIIPKAKMTSENTITLEAEGDPAVFNMNLTVLRPEDGDMMKLVQYDLVANA
jgi:hypothetical protein